MRRFRSAFKHSAAALCLLVLLLFLCLSAFSAGESISLLATAERSGVRPGEQVTITVSVFASSRTRLEGMSFHIQHSDTLAILETETPASEHFLLTSYNPETSFFSAAAPISDELKEGETWCLLILTCRIDPEADEDPVLFVSDAVDGNQDPKWCVFELDENGKERDLACDLTRASCIVSLAVSEPPAEASGTETEGSTQEQEHEVPDDSSTVPPGSADPDTSEPYDSDPGGAGQDASLPETQEDAHASSHEAAGKDSQPDPAGKEPQSDTDVIPEDDSQHPYDFSLSEGLRSRGAVLIASGTVLVLLIACGAFLRNRRRL